MVEHLPKFLLCHVRVRIHHLESREEKFFNAKLTNSQYVNLKVVTMTSSVKCVVMSQTKFNVSLLDTKNMVLEFDYL